MHRTYTAVAWIWHADISGYSSTLKGSLDNVRTGTICWKTRTCVSVANPTVNFIKCDIGEEGIGSMPMCSLCARLVPLTTFFPLGSLHSFSWTGNQCWILQVSRQLAAAAAAGQVLDASTSFTCSQALPYASKHNFCFFVFVFISVVFQLCFILLRIGL